MAINSIVIEGRVAQPEYRVSANGLQLLTFRLATKLYRGKDKEDDTCWTQVKVWGKQADSLNRFIQKGMDVVVQGSLDYSEWEAKDGSGKRSMHSISASSVKLPPKQKEEETPSVGVYEDEDIPF